MQKYFNDKKLKNKYYFKIIDLEANDLESNVNEAVATIVEWNGGLYLPDFDINICVNDDAVLPSRVIKGLKNGISKIVSTTYAIISTSIIPKHWLILLKS